MRKTVFFFVSFRRRAMQAWVLFLVSIERGTPMPDLSLPSLAVGHEPAWEAPCRFLARPGCGTRRCVGPTRAKRLTKQTLRDRSGNFSGQGRRRPGPIPVAPTDSLKRPLGQQIEGPFCLN